MLLAPDVDDANVEEWAWPDDVAIEDVAFKMPSLFSFSTIEEPLFLVRGFGLDALSE